MKTAFFILLAAYLFALPSGAANAQDQTIRKAVYMTLAGPLEIIREPNGYVVLLNARRILESKSGALTVQSYMSVGEPRQGYDAMLLRRGVGDAKCPIVYDLITVGEDGKYAVAPGFNACSRLIDVRVGDGELYFVFERPNGKKETLVYDDAGRSKSAGGSPVVKMRRSSLGALPEK